MDNSLYSSLVNMLDPRDIRKIGGALGESEQAVSQGLHSAVAATMGNLASTAGDPMALRKALDLLPDSTGDFTWSNVIEGAADAQSPATARGKRVLSGLFGSSEGNMLAGLARASGLRSAAMSTLMAAVVPFVLSFIRKRVRDEGLSMSGLASILQRETPAIRSALPTGLGDIIWPRVATAAAATSPVVAQTVTTERSTNWALPLALGALALGAFWFFNHARRPRVETTQVYTPRADTADRVAIPEPVRHRAIIDDTELHYRTGSAELLPESRERLERISVQLLAAPDVRMKVSGHTDDVGNADRNMTLSQQRADGVMEILVGKGVDRSRLSSQGYGEESPIAPNSTQEGRAQNRRVTVSIE